MQALAARLGMKIHELHELHEFFSRHGGKFSATYINREAISIRVIRVIRG